MTNLVKLYTHNGVVLIDTAQHETGKTLLTIYTLRGNRLYDTKRGQEMSCCSVHRNNLFASKELANAHREAIYANMEARSIKH